jgi:hypothetical protein
MGLRSLVKHIFIPSSEQSTCKKLNLKQILAMYKNDYKAVECDNFELVFVCDNNDDKPNNEILACVKEFIVTFHVKNYQIIESEMKINIAISRNIAIQRCNGQYIKFCDDDDISCSINNINKIIKNIAKVDKEFDVIDARQICVKCEPIGLLRQMDISNGIWGYIFAKDFLLSKNLYFLPSFSITEDGLFIQRILKNLSYKLGIPKASPEEDYFYVYLTPSLRYSQALEDQEYRETLAAIYCYDILSSQKNTKKIPLEIDFRTTKDKLMKIKSPKHDDVPIHKDEIRPFFITSSTEPTLKYELMFVTNSARNIKINEINDWEAWNKTVTNDLFIKSY